MVDADFHRNRDEGCRRVGEQGSKQLRSGSLKCLWVIYLGLSSKLLVSFRTRDTDLGVFSRQIMDVETMSE